MCGLVGFTRARLDGDTIVSSMLDTLIHRGPDTSGAYIGSNIAFGHRRLIIIDPIGGTQPCVDQSTGDALIFNGEIYGYQDHAKELRAKGIRLQDNSDTTVLFQMLRQYGLEKTLGIVDGMFAFAYFEGASQTLFLARDRFGEKPLFYGLQGGELAFASEIKALRQHPAFQNVELDPNAMHRFMTFEYLPGNESGYKNICKLRPGTFITFKEGTLTETTYWKPQIGQTTQEVSEEEAIDKLDYLLNESVRQRLVADVPVGLFLSGGVDSGLLTAIARRHTQDIAAYTVKMPDQSYDETPHAQRIAQHCGVKHHIVDLTDSDVLDAFDSLTTMLDEPLADYSLLPTYMVCKAAKKGMTVALSGDGGDELFGGYASFKAQRLAWLMQFIPKYMGDAFRSCLDLLPNSDGYMSKSFVARYVSQGFGAPVDRQNFLWMSTFTEKEKSRLWHHDMVPPGGQTDTFKTIDDTNEPVGGIERLLSQFTRYYLPEDILAKVDRASMMNSLEVRAPFLSREFSEFALSLPSKWKVHRGTTKVLLKKLATRYLPTDLVYQPKHGFGLPLSALLRGALKERVTDVLLNPNNPVAGWFNKSEIEKLLSSHMNFQQDNRKKIWTLFILFTIAARTP